MPLPKLNVAQRLWIGLALVVALFSAADLVSLNAARQVDETLVDLVQAGDERRGAGFEMRASLSAIAEQVKSQGAADRASSETALRQAQRTFVEHLKNYADQIQEPIGRQLAQTVHAEYVRLTAAIQPLIASSAALSSERAQALALKQELLALLAQRAAMRQPAQDRARAQSTWGPRAESARQAPESHIPGRAGSAPILRQEVRRDAVAPSAAMQMPPDRDIPPFEGQDIETSVRSVALLLDAGAGVLPKDQIRRATAQLQKHLRSAHLHASDASQQQWVERCTIWNERVLRSAMTVQRLEEAKADRLRVFEEQRQALDVLLAQTVQPAARADLAAAVQRASRIAHDANTTITHSLAVAMLLGIIVAIVTVRTVRAPLGKVLASIRGIAAGDFSKRVNWHSADELGELAGAFDSMAAQLQTSTVSRAYLEGIVNSISDAVFVVDSGGRLATINPAVLTVLGYGEDELKGKPLAHVLDAPAAVLAATPDAPLLRRPYELKSKSGERIPVLLSSVRLRLHGGTAPATVCVAQDQRDRLAVEQHQRQTAVVFDNTREALVLTDASFALELANPAYYDLTGLAAPPASATVIPTLLRGREGVVEEMQSSAAHCGQWEGELQLVRVDGSVRPVWLNVAAVRDAGGAPAQYVFVLSDISEMKEIERKLDELAHYDALTLLPNRRLFLERAKMALERAVRSGRSVALLYLDLDDFKDINDTFGHDQGDALLSAMAQRLIGCVRSSDTLARLGGDEFVLMLEDVEAPLTPTHVAEKVLHTLSQPYLLASIELRPRASIGISLGPSQATTVDELLKAADAAMYRAKHRGGATFEFFTPALTHQAMEKLRLHSALRHPDFLSQLVLYYQPQITAGSGQIVGAEALIRWQHPEAGLLLPGQFMGAVEETGMIGVLGEWVLQRACEDAARWAEVYPQNPLRVAVNVSAHQIKHEGLVEVVRRCLNTSGLDPVRLELEVTEDALQVEGMAQRVLNQLKALNVRLALDDFGSGYSSLGSLKALPFDRVKVDRMFVRDVQEDADAASIIRAIIAMAHTLRMQVLAEGVENLQQLKFLQDNGCDEAQGYFIGRPMPLDAFERDMPSGLLRKAGPSLSVIGR